MDPPCPVAETAWKAPSPVRTCNFRKIRTTWTSRLVPTALSAPVRMAVRLAASARRPPGCPARVTRALRGPRFHARRRSPMATGMALPLICSRRVCTPCPLRDSPGLPRPTWFLLRSFRRQTLGRVRRRILICLRTAWCRRLADDAPTGLPRRQRLPLPPALLVLGRGFSRALMSTQCRRPLRRAWKLAIFGCRAPCPPRAFRVA